MRVLVFNCGTDSIRFKVINPDKNLVIAKGGIEAISTPNSYSNYMDSSRMQFSEFPYKIEVEN